MPRRPMKSFTRRSTRLRDTKPNLLTRGKAIKAMLSRTDIVGTMPSAFRSSGSSTVPAASEARGEPVRTRRPATSTRPPSTRWVPKIALTVSERPRTDWLPAEVDHDPYGFLYTGADAAAYVSWKLERSPHPHETSVPGLFAVGDVRAGSVKRVASAVGEGSVVVSEIHQFLATPQA